VPTETLLERVKLTLAQREINYSLERGHLLRVEHGSADVAIDVEDRPGSSTVAVRAIVLAEVEASDMEAELRILRSVNERNARSRFGRFYWDRSTAEIILEYKILGSHLQPEEMINALSAVATGADDQDDLLMEELGTGRRASDVRGRTEVARSF
jgi:hypothetical protein